MKKYWGLVLAVFLALIFILPGGADAGPNIKIQVNGQELASDVNPVLDGSRTLVPLRVIMEYFGADVTYQHAAKTVTVIKSRTVLILGVNKKDAFINGVPVTLDVPAKIVSGRILVPLRLIGQSLGAKVDWEDQTKTVLILTDSQEPKWDSGKGREVEKEIFELANTIRREHGLEPLIWIDELANIAFEHSRDMAENNFFDHQSPSKGSPDDRARVAGFQGVGENIAAGYLDAETVFGAWMKSPDHRANILDPDYRFTGVGFYREDDDSDCFNGRYYTQEFLKGEAVLIKPSFQSTVSSGKVTVEGWCAGQEGQLVVFKMVDAGSYSERKTENYQAKNHRFSFEIPLENGKGLYVLKISDYDIRYVTYR